MAKKSDKSGKKRNLSPKQLRWLHAQLDKGNVPAARAKKLKAEGKLGKAVKARPSDERKLPKHTELQRKQPGEAGAADLIKTVGSFNPSERGRLLIDVGGRKFTADEGRITAVDGEEDALYHMRKRGDIEAKGYTLMQFDSIADRDQALAQISGKSLSDDRVIPSVHGTPKVLRDNTPESAEWIDNNVGSLSKPGLFPDTPQGQAMISAVLQYQGDDYAAMNALKRSGVLPKSPQKRAEIKRGVKDLERAFDQVARPIKDPIQVVRHVNSDFADNLRASFRKGELVGTEIIDRGFVSTSRDHSVVANNHSGAVQMYITAGKGKKALVVPGGESELLFNTARMRVTSAQADGDTLRVYLDLLD